MIIITLGIYTLVNSNFSLTLIIFAISLFVLVLISNLKITGRRKNKSSLTEDFPTIVADVQHANEKHDKRNHLKSDDLPQKVLVSKSDSSSSSSKCEPDTSSSIQIDGRSNNIVKSTANAERWFLQLYEICLSDFFDSESAKLKYLSSSTGSSYFLL